MSAGAARDVQGVRATTVATSRGRVDCLVAGAAGQQPLLVLIHPLAASAELWRPLMAWLAAHGCPTLAPTLPAGRDTSGMNPHTSLVDMAATVGDVIMATCGEPVSVLGMSMGGCVALQLALDHGTKVRRLILVDTTASYGDDRLQKWEQRACAAETAVRRVDLLPFQLDRWFSDTFRATDAPEVQRAADVFVDCPPAVHAACCRALGAFDCTPALGTLPQPALVIVGEHDYATPPDMARSLARGIPNAELVVLPGVRHMSIIEDRASWDRVRVFAAAAA